MNDVDGVVQNLTEQFRERARVAVLDAGGALVNALKRKAPKKTGKMASGIQITKVTDYGSRVTARIKIPFPSRFLEFGTRDLDRNWLIRPSKTAFVRYTLIVMHNPLIDIMRSHF